jgi:hypothetical protein
MDNVWLVILLIRAKHNYPRALMVKVNPKPNIFHLNQIRPTVDRKQKTPEI